MWDESASREAGSAHVLVSISFHFNRGRLKYLADVMRELVGFRVAALEVVVFTNTAELAEVGQIFTILISCGLTGTVTTVDALPHPFDLTWAHKSIIASWSRDARRATSHFIYLEDDERFNFTNFLYALQARRDLKAYGLLPGFARTEWSARSNHLVSLDSVGPVSLADRSSVSIDGRDYINLDNPYCGAYVLDRELADEYVQSNSFDRDLSASVIPWDVRERAAAGLTWEAVPEGFSSRCVVPVDLRRKIIDPSSWLAHLPNNYADDERTAFGKVPMHLLIEGDVDRARRQVSGHAQAPVLPPPRFP